MDREFVSTQELKQPVPSRKKRVMIAGVGNMFMKDDGFGSAVIKKMMLKRFPEGVELRDFRTFCLKLAYDLMNGYDALVLVDVSMRGEKPGTLYVIEPDENEISGDLQASPIDPHGGDPSTVLRFVKAIGSWPGFVLIVAREPESLDDFEMGLSKPVTESVDKAIELVDEIIERIYTQSK